MHSSQRMKRIFAAVYVPLAAIYLSLSYIYPTDPTTIANRHLSLATARFIALAFAAIFIFIWLFAFYAAWVLNVYSHSIRQYKDGDAFLMLSYAMLVLAIYLPVRCISKISLNYAAHLHPAFTTPSNMVITYINVLFPLIIYTYISMGGYKLFRMVKGKVPSAHFQLLVLLLSVISGTYCFAAFAASTKLTPTDWLVTIDYGIAAPLRTVTLVIPYLFMWTIGLIATYQIYFYQQNIKGIIYKDSLKLLSVGLTLEILATIAVQYLTTIAANIQHFPTIIMLLLTATILSFVVVAYIMIVKGVNRLRMMEELV